MHFSSVWPGARIPVADQEEGVGDPQVALAGDSEQAPSPLPHPHPQAVLKLRLLPWGWTH